MESARDKYLAKLADYYAGVPSEKGFARKCSMDLPDGLGGMRIIDIGCRRGKGVMKLAERAGAHGFVLGIDWIPAHIDAAREYAREHCRNPEESAPCEFLAGYPEALDAAGVPPASFDAAFVNCSMNLFHDIPKAFSQIAQCLKPGSLLVVDGVFADAPRDPHVVQQARELDNSVQAALALDDFLNLLATCGFTQLATTMGETVCEHEGFTKDTVVACASSCESVAFMTCRVEARRREGPRP